LEGAAHFTKNAVNCQENVGEGDKEESPTVCRTLLVTKKGGTILEKILSGEQSRKGKKKSGRKTGKKKKKGDEL